MQNSSTTSWRVGKHITWVANSNTNGSNVDYFWSQPYTKIRLRDRTRFIHDEFAEVSSALQANLKTLHEYLVSTTASVHTKGNTSKLHKANGAYIWKVFRQQAYNLWKGGHQELNDRTIISELQELLDDVAMNRELCRKARDELEDPARNVTQKEKLRLGLSKIKAAVKSLNNCTGIPPEWMTDDLKYCFNWLHEEIEKLQKEYDDEDSLQIDPVKFPKFPQGSYIVPPLEPSMGMTFAEFEEYLKQWPQDESPQGPENLLDRSIPTETNEPNPRKRGREDSSEPESDPGQGESRIQTLSRKKIRGCDSGAEAEVDHVQEIERPPWPIPNSPGTQT